MNTITLNLDNGETLSAPIGIWLAAMLSSLPHEQQTAVKEQVAQMVRDQKLLIPQHHRIDAEPLNMNFKGHGNGSV